MEPLFRNDSCSKGSPSTAAKQARRVQQIRLRGDQLPGGKALIWDPTLTGPMGLIAEYSVLKEHQVF